MDENYLRMKKLVLESEKLVIEARKTLEKFSEIYKYKVVKIEVSG